MKAPEEMNDHELLVELLKSQRSDMRAQRLAAIGTLLLAAIFAVVAYLMVPRAIDTVSRVNVTLEQVSSTLNEVDTTLLQMQGTLTEAETTVRQAQDSLALIDGMVGNVSALVEENTEVLSETIQKIGSIDFEKLNNSINDLNSVIEPLTKFFRR